MRRKIPENTATFAYTNANPKGRKTSDCVVRAISIAENRPWLDVFDELTEIARNDFTLLNSPDCYKKYLKKYPKVNVFFFDGDDKKKRFKVKDICRMKGTFIVSVANHLTCVKDGKIHDTWDCGHKSVYEIWKAA